MHRIVLGLAILALAAVAGAQTFVLTLAGDREAGAAGDTDGRGLAVISINGTSIRYYLWVKGVDAPTASHIHTGRAGENGAVLVGFPGVFSSPAAGVHTLQGTTTASAQVIASILQAPSGFYANVHNATFPGGAVRGQLLGDGPSPLALSSTLLGAREAGGNGDPDGTGFAAAILAGTDVYYYMWVSGIAAPTIAHIHSGNARQSGPVLVDFSPSFSDGTATGRVTTSAATVADIMADPESYYFNVHNAEFPGGALRGQLTSTESLIVFPVLARVTGAGTSNFKSDIRVMSLTDEDVPVWFEWYPKSATGSPGPAMVVQQSVAAGGTAVFDDAIFLLFGANDRGAVRVLSPFPMRAAAITYNDQRANGSGTFGQYVEGLGHDQALTSGALVLNSDRPKADLLDFRTNAGYFVPGPGSATVTFNVRKPDGSLVAPPSTRTFPGWSNDLALYHQTIPGIGAAVRTQPNFSVTFTSTVPIFLYSSVVDNKTDDGLHQAAVPIPAALVESPNAAPNGTITSPASPVSTSTGLEVSFAGTGTDPDGDQVSARWDFGDSTSATGLTASHAWAATGAYLVRFTVTDEHGLADPTPAEVTVTVGQTANNPPQGTITSPSNPASTTVGTPVSFTGTGTDPDGDTVTAHWQFGDSGSATGLVASHAYSVAGSYTVQLAVTDEHGLADPTPAEVTVNVGDSPYTLSAVQAQIFTPLCSGCHPPNRGMDLRAGNAYASIVNVSSVENPALKRVLPGDPDNSYLYQKLESGAMPQGGPALSDTHLQLVRGWILAGAPNN